MKSIISYLISPKELNMNLVSRLMLVLGIAVAGVTMTACQKSEQAAPEAAPAEAAPEAAPMDAAPEAAPMDAAPVEEAPAEAAPAEEAPAEAPAEEGAAH
jgi:hypothetical protein